MKRASFAALLLISQSAAGKDALPPAEVLQLHVKGEVSYRCFAGYDAAGHPKADVFDSRTHEPCDNKDYKKTVVDKSIKVKIEIEPSPDDAKDLMGSWSETYRFKGHAFSAAISLLKAAAPAANPYTISISAEDDEPISRKTTVAADFASAARMNRLRAEYSSAGTKEEVSFVLDVAPEK